MRSLLGWSCCMELLDGAACFVAFLFSLSCLPFPPSVLGFGVQMIPSSPEVLVIAEP